jgi:hypothetical protein
MFHLLINWNIKNENWKSISIRPDWLKMPINKVCVLKIVFYAIKYIWINKINKNWLWIIYLLFIQYEKTENWLSVFTFEKCNVFFVYVTFFNKVAKSANYYIIIIIIIFYI